MLSINPCNLCPRMCGAARTREAGYCGCGSGLKAARAALHFWEEPCISGKNGSGTVFFSGCNLKCCYCQNASISHGRFGKEISVERLADIFIALQEQGAHNINLVTATPYLPWVVQALDLVKPRLNVPVVYNCGGYERPEAVEALSGYVDIFLPDLKYRSPELAKKYSGAADYFAVAVKAIKVMIAQAGKPEFDADGMLQKGVVVRHLVLPGCRTDSMDVLRWMAENLEKGSFLLSLMSQYTPTPDAAKFPELCRRLTSLEYDSVVAEAVRLGLDTGFMQERSSAKEEYTPPFDLEGV